MARLYLAGIFVIIIMTFLISSVTSGFLSKEMTWARLMLLGGFVCLVLGGSWLYLSGGVDDLVWLYNVPTRPDGEMAFVSLVQDAMRKGPAEASSRERDRTCLSQTAEIEEQLPIVTDWTGTVWSVYGVGPRMVLVVRIGRYTRVGTNYNYAADAVLIDPGTRVFDHAIELQSGDRVQFSGSFVKEARPCIFVRDIGRERLGAELVFQFTALAKQ